MNNMQLSTWVSGQLQENDSFNSAYDSDALKNIVRSIDLTSLNATDNELFISEFVSGGLSLLKENNLPPVAAICVFSNFTSLVSEILKETSVSTACVAAAFPHGQADLNSKVLEVKNAHLAGADDIDVVINRGLVLTDDYEGAGKEIEAFSHAAEKSHLKVILEVCELNLEQIYKASKVAMNNGADFIKTSTGKGASGASLEASLVMCLAIKEHFQNTGKQVGFKAAGGISSPKEAIQYWNLVTHVLGKDWLSSQYFRIGASSLLKNVISEFK